LQAQASGLDAAIAETLDGARTGNGVTEQSGAEFQLRSWNAAKDFGPGGDDLVVELGQPIERCEFDEIAAYATRLRCGVRRRVAEAS
jgi:hypothetical protein